MRVTFLYDIYLSAQFYNVRTEKILTDSLKSLTARWREGNIISNIYIKYPSTGPVVPGQEYYLS